VVDDAIRFVAQGHNLKDKLKDYEYNKQLGYNNNAQGEEGHTDAKRNVLFYLLATKTTMLILVLILFYQYVYSLEIS